MITGELKNKINALWEIFWTGGITNPLDVVEQMTYLMFIHDLDETDNLRAKESAMLGLPYKSMFGEEVQIGERTVPGNQLKWSVFHDFPRREDVHRDAGAGVPLHQEPPRGQGQRLRQVHGRRHLQNPHTADAGQGCHRPG